MPRWECTDCKFTRCDIVYSGEKPGKCIMCGCVELNKVREMGIW